MRNSWQTAVATAFLTAEALAAPFGGSLGFLGRVEFPMESFGYRSAWPVTPGVGMSYEIPAHEKLAWMIDWTYAYRVIDHETQPEDSRYYSRVIRRGDDIYEQNVDYRTRGHFANFRATPCLIAWKHFQFGFGYYATLSYTRNTGYNHYRYYYPERREETRAILSDNRLMMDQGLDLTLGARLGAFRMMTRLGSTDLGYGYSLWFSYFPWQTRK